MKKMSLPLCLLVSLHIFGQNASRVSVPPPLAFMGNITRPYGQGTNLVTGKPWFHKGIDIWTPMRTPVLAAMPGIVSAAGEDRALGACCASRSKLLGNYMILDQNRYKTVYARLDEIAAVKGRRVARGETIAFSGNTGLSTGPHLHFGVYLDGEAPDPLSVRIEGELKRG